jgi:hypothetical protein
MTFQEYVSNQKVSVRAYNGISKYRITEYTPFIKIIQSATIGRHSSSEIEQLQKNYIKTFDVAYQQVIEFIRGIHHD